MVHTFVSVLDMFIELLFGVQEKKQKLETQSKRSLTEAINIPDLLACIADFGTAGERAQGLAQVSRVFSVICTQSKAALLYKREVDREVALAESRKFREPNNYFNNAWIEYLIPLALQPKHHKALCQVFHRLYRVDAQFEADVMDKKKSTLPDLSQSMLLDYHDVRNALLGHCLVSLAGSANSRPIPGSDSRLFFESLCCGHRSPIYSKTGPFLLCTDCKKHIKIWMERLQPDWRGLGVFRTITAYFSSKFGWEPHPAATARQQVDSVIRFIVTHRSGLGIN